RLDGPAGLVLGRLTGHIVLGVADDVGVVVDRVEPRRLGQRHFLLRDFLVRLVCGFVIIVPVWIILRMVYVATGITLGRDNNMHVCRKVWQFNNVCVQRRIPVIVI